MADGHAFLQMEVESRNANAGVSDLTAVVGVIAFSTVTGLRVMARVEGRQSSNDDDNRY